MAGPSSLDRSLHVRPGATNRTLIWNFSDFRNGERLVAVERSPNESQRVLLDGDAGRTGSSKIFNDDSQTRLGSAARKTVFPTGVSAGVYFVRLEAKGVTHTRKVVLLRLYGFIRNGLVLNQSYADINNA